MVKKKKTPYGYIYRATNRINGKNYIGKTDKSTWKKGQNPIEERWNVEVNKAKARERRGERLRHIESAIVKYGEENFKLTELDIAHNQKELNRKENEYIIKYDTMNPKKGYNLKEGGLGGRLSEIAKENLSRIGKEKWQYDQEYKNKQLKERNQRGKDPEFREKMTKINQEKGKDSQFRENVSNAIKKKYDKDLEYAKTQTRDRRERANDPEFFRKMREINSQYR
ncbi:MAG: GIY-YIG nuclease family protein [Candidatus Odinarchaeota archaeon]